MPFDLTVQGLTLILPYLTLILPLLYRDVDVPKLRIAIRVIRTLLGLAIALQAIVQVMKNLRDLHVADGMLLLTQFLGDGPCTFANPSIKVSINGSLPYAFRA